MQAMFTVVVLQQSCLVLWLVGVSDQFAVMIQVVSRFIADGWN